VTKVVPWPATLVTMNVNNSTSKNGMVIFFSNLLQPGEGKKNVTPKRICPVQTGYQMSFIML
jgi:hypothetical protein